MCAVGSVTPYEIARRAVAPFMPALEGEVAALLAEAVPRGATLLDVGGRKSPYTIGLPASVTVSELPRESEHQHQHNLGLDDAGVAALRRTRSNVAGVVFDDMSCSALGAASFDAAVAVEVIEHVDDDEGFVRNLARVVRPGGPVVLTTPNGDARPVHGADHRRHYRRDQLIKLVTPYFDVVFVRYAVAMTDNRLVGMQPFSPRRPRWAANRVACSGPGSRRSSRCRRRVW